MGIYIIIFVFFVCLIIVIIFWLLAYINNFFLFKRNKPQQKLIFECGFKAFSAMSLNINFNFFTSACLIILYELELLFILPFMFNHSINLFTPYFLFSVFVFFLLITVLLDSQFKMIEWNF